MGTIRRAISSADDLSQIQYGRYPSSTIMDFEETPCTYDEAAAHLEIFNPRGRIVVAGRRGPKGGWGSLVWTDHLKHPKAYQTKTFHRVVSTGEW